MALSLPPNLFHVLARLFENTLLALKTQSFYQLKELLHTFTSFFALVLEPLQLVRYSEI